MKKVSTYIAPLVAVGIAAVMALAPSSVNGQENIRERYILQQHWETLKQWEKQQISAKWCPIYEKARFKDTVLKWLRFDFVDGQLMQIFRFKSECNGFASLKWGESVFLEDGQIVEYLMLHGSDKIERWVIAVPR